MSWREPQLENYEQQVREYILNFIREKNLIDFQENVIFSPKAFRVNAFLKWCLDQNRKNKLSSYKWKKYEKILRQYLAGVVDLTWTNKGYEATDVKWENINEVV